MLVPIVIIIITIKRAMLIKFVTAGWKLYSSIKGAGFALLKIEQLQHIYHVLHDTLIEQSLHNQLLQSCIPNLEGIYFVINTIANKYRHYNIIKQKINQYKLAMVSDW